MAHDPASGARTPDEIVAGWQAMLATGAHLHLPQIAKGLGVTEAALVAARTGQGAVRLLPDLPRVLAPVADWHRVLAVASTGLGVFMPMDHVTSVSCEAGLLRLAGTALWACVECARAHEVFLFEDQDPRRGRSRTIQVFDRNGSPLIRLVIFHKPSFRAAKDWTASLLHPDQTRTSLCRAYPAQPTPQPAAGQDVWGAFADRLHAAQRAGAHLSVTAHRPGLDAGWRGVLTGLRQDGAMIHLHETSLRAHLDLGRAVSATSGTIHAAGDDTPSLTLERTAA